MTALGGRPLAPLKRCVHNDPHHLLPLRQNARSCISLNMYYKCIFKEPINDSLDCRPDCPCKSHCSRARRTWRDHHQTLLQADVHQPSRVEKRVQPAASTKRQSATALGSTDIPVTL